MFGLLRIIRLRFYCFVLVLTFLDSIPSQSQPNYDISVTNGVKTNENNIEFEIYLKSTSTHFLLTAYQCVFTFNNEIINGGNISFSYVEGSAHLNNIPSCGIGVDSCDSQLKLTFASTVGSDTVSSISNLVGKFRLTNSVPFAGLGLSVFWNFSGRIYSILMGANFANITNPLYHSDLKMLWDITPPSIQSVSVIDSSNLIVDFSEILDTTNIKDLNNYSITNGVNVLKADAISPGGRILLSTSKHTAGSSYMLSVQNLNDLSGNRIAAPGNSANYSFEEILQLHVKLFLEGPFHYGLMDAALNELQFIPPKQPFNVSPWNYQGIEQVTAIPPDVVDWIFIELRTGMSRSTTVARRAAFLKRNGLIVDIDGTSNLKFYGFSGLYYVVIKHRNHLGVISSDKINISSATSFYDFTTSMSSAFGTNSLVYFGAGIYGLYAGDCNGDGIIDDADMTSIWKKENGTIGYESGDIDLNGGVNIVDKNQYWQINKGKASNIPIE